MDVSAADLRASVTRVLTGADLAKMTLRKTMTALVAHYDVSEVDLAPRKHEVRGFIGEFLLAMQNAEDQDADEGDGDEEEDEEEDEEDARDSDDEDEEDEGANGLVKAQRGAGRRKGKARRGVEEDDSEEEGGGRSRVKRKKAAPAAKGGKKRRRTAETESDEEDVKWKPVRLSGLSKALILDDALSELCGSRVMPRSQIQKEIIAYVKKHELQDEKDKRTIHADDTLKRIFASDTFTLFGLSKLISDHVSKPEDAGEEMQAAALAKDAATLEEMQAERERKIANGEKPRATGSRKKKPTTAKASRASGNGAPSNRASGLMAPMHLSDKLMAVCGGVTVLTRPQVVKALWDYIKQNNLKDPKDGRQICCDEKLSAIFDGEVKVSGFGMNKYLSAHLTKVNK